MKLSPYMKKTGLCRVCGKPTKLLIHVECGKKMDLVKRKRARAIQHYSTRKLPDWMYS